MSKRGTPTDNDSSDDQTCGDLGYPVSCDGVLHEIGENFTADHFDWSAPDEAVCNQADGARIGE